MQTRIRESAAALRHVPVDLVTTDELVAYLRCHRATIDRMVKRGVIKPIKLGRVWRFDRRAVIDALSTP